jgi:hypothetical protein
MKAGTFAGVLDTLTDADVQVSGGAYDRSGNAVNADTISRYGVLRQTAPGSPRYWVGVKDPTAKDGFQPYFNAGETPAPLVFDMRQLAGHRPPSSGTEPVDYRNLAPREVPLLPATL